MDINTCWVYPFAKHHHGNHQYEVIESQKSQHVQRRACKYCWWKKSCTSWDVKLPVNNGINYQPQLVIAGFLPSTVCHERYGYKRMPKFLHLETALAMYISLETKMSTLKRDDFPIGNTFQPLIFRGHVNFRGSTTSWWLFHQPIWNICASQIVSSPQVEIKQNVSKHQLDQVCCLLLLPQNLT